MDIGSKLGNILDGTTINSFQGTSTFRSSWSSLRLEMVSLDSNFGFIGIRLVFRIRGLDWFFLD